MPLGLPAKLHDLEVTGGQRPERRIQHAVVPADVEAPLMNMSEPLSATISPYRFMARKIF